MERYDMRIANTLSHACTRCLDATQGKCVRKMCQKSVSVGSELRRRGVHVVSTKSYCVLSPIPLTAPSLWFSVASVQTVFSCGLHSAQSVFWDPPPVALCHLLIRVDSVRITLRNHVVVHRRACRFLLHLGSLLTISSWFVRLVDILLSALFHPLQVRSLTCCESARVPTGSLCILFLHLYRFFETKASWLHFSAAVAQKNSSPVLERLSVMETAWSTDRDLVMFTRQTCPCT